MSRIATYTTIALVGLACYACESPMEVATEASAHPADGGAAAQQQRTTGESATGESDTDAVNPAVRDRYPLPGPRSVAQSSSGSGDESDESTDDSLNGELNLNRANRDKLEMLPGVGPVTAERIEDYRKKRRFEEIDDIKRIKGVGDATFTDMKQYLAVSGETTLSE